MPGMIPSSGPMQFAAGGAFGYQALSAHLARGRPWAAAFAATGWSSSSRTNISAGAETHERPRWSGVLEIPSKARLTRLKSGYLTVG